MPTAKLTRRQLLGGVAATLATPGWAARPGTPVPPVAQPSGPIGPYPAEMLPDGMRSRFVNGVNGLRMHVLEAGFGEESRPAVLLLHGFPELAYSWRRVMPRLADAGYRVLAPDLRGYGRTDGSDVAYDADLRPFRLLNEIRDMVSLVSAFGLRRTHLVGHDFGAIVAAWCAVARPDVFRSVALMSAPFSGTAILPFDTANSAAGAQAPVTEDIDLELARQSPRRKHYRRYYATREANTDMWHAPQGVHAFLRGYYHMKSGDWAGNMPFPLEAWSAAELAKLPHYYVMELDKTMAETVAPHMPSAADIARSAWLPDQDLRIYSQEYARTGFQGGLQWYRSNTSVSSLFGAGGINGDLRVFAGRSIDQPSLFVAGLRDWGIYQRPGALEYMQTRACTDMRDVHLLEGAGHWVQQERAEAVSALLVEFLGRAV